MNTLQLTPPLLVLTMGYPGSGKTFFARQFAESFKLAHISEDRIRFELFESPQFNQDEAEIIGRMQHYMLDEAMRTKQTLVCEGEFLSLASRQAVYTLAAQHGYRTLTVWLQTDIETSAQRAAQRDRRNPDNKYSFSIDRQLFNELKSNLNRPSEKERAVVISGKHAFKSQSLTVLRKIASIYSEELAKSKPVNTSRPPLRSRNLGSSRRMMIQ